MTKSARAHTVLSIVIPALNEEEAIGSTVERCQVASNEVGIHLGEGCTGSQLVSNSNRNAGIYDTGSSSLSQCTANDNGSYGLSGDSTVFDRCTAHRNTNAGISALHGGAITGCSTDFNQGFGIRASGTGVRIEDCRVFNNLEFGIYAQGSGHLIVRNLSGLNQNGVGGMGNNFLINGSNAVGEILDIRNGMTLSGSKHPLANYSH